MKNNQYLQQKNKTTIAEMLSRNVLFAVTEFEKNQHLYKIYNDIRDTNNNYLIAVEQSKLDIFNIYILNKQGNNLMLSDEHFSELQLVGRFDYIILHSYSPDYFETFKQQIG